LSILVADDVNEIRNLIQHYLTSAGHTVAGAATGDEALRILKERHFDLLITDVIMPDGDGIGLITELKKLNPAARILVISGGGKYFLANECVAIAERMGAHAALFKPFFRTNLLEAVGR